MCDASAIQNKQIGERYVCIKGISLNKLNGTRIRPISANNDLCLMIKCSILISGKNTLASSKA